MSKQTEDKGPCKCGACRDAFRRLKYFDLHRAGPYGDRRCLSPTEMLGMGLERDSLGRWYKPDYEERARRVS